MTTIYDVAKTAGVSAATASRILRGVDHPARPETIERVLRAAKELHYRPNAIARSLVAGKTHAVALLLPTVMNDYYTQLAARINERSYEDGYLTYLCVTDRKVERETELVRNLLERRVDGVIFSPTRMRPEDNPINIENVQRLAAANMPSVVFGSRFTGTCQVYCDTRTGAREATEYLLSLGHTRIGFIDGLDAGTQGNRHAGYARAHDERGTKVLPELYRQGGLTFTGGMNATRELLSLPEPPTAFLTVNHMMALGAMEACESLGLRIPQDISLIGFDDSPLSAVVKPPLTVVQQSLVQMADAACRLLMRRMEDPGFVETAECACILTKRGSCAPPPKPAVAVHGAM